MMAEQMADKPKRSALNQLTRTLLRKYNCGVRLVQNCTNVLKIYFLHDGKTQLVTTSIWYRQVGMNCFLVWDPEEFDGITEISLPSEAIWVPDLISEFVDVGESPAIPYVYVNSSGMVKNNKPIQVVSACDLELLCTHPVQRVNPPAPPAVRGASAHPQHLPHGGGRHQLLLAAQQWHAHFKTSILLGYTVFRVNLMDEMPATTIRTPLMGVLFAVCMALLVLTLSISIFVVKLLYHNEKEVKEMSVSACLLDKYGSSSQTFLESNFTSVKTLNDVDQCGGFEFDLAPEELLSLSEPQESTPRLESILQEVVALRLYLQEGESDDSAQVALCCKVDLLLFRVYLLILVVYTSTLLLLWAIWSSA
ncbi:unnamed protein product [Oncorhynchus mykiss]|uniref:Neurotransmitter-gated ion-channel ligand-binding domain-containing protein n=1 Tax=Oncorhynchus mykiss TaxID=8022 RepID=A0A060WZV3_ONCMY|nr:unnamed protein product [Oncorhynchus mykiss]